MSIKKCASLLLVAVMLLSALPLSVLASNRILLEDFDTIETSDPNSVSTPSSSFSEENRSSCKKATRSYAGTLTGVNFYEQLENDAQRAIYNSLKALTGTETTLAVSVPGNIKFDSSAYPIPTAEREALNLIVKKNVQISIEAFQKDCPEIFWLKFGTGGTSYKYSLTGDVNASGGYSWEVFKITFTFVVLDAYVGKIESIKKDLQTAVAGMNVITNSRYQVAQSIHDWLAKNVTFDLYSNCINEVTGALLYGSASSDGYAKAFKFVCDYYNIPSIVVSGTRLTSYGKTTHMWNYMLMEDNNWYAVDCAWDDQTTDAYLIIYYDFFLVGTGTYAVHLGGKTFAESHTPLGDFSGNGYKTFVYPTLSQTCIDVDYTKLTILLQIVLPYEDKYYTADSIAAFRAAMLAGNAVDPHLEKSQQNIIDAAADAILAAYNNLKLITHIRPFAGNTTVVVDPAKKYIYGLSEGIAQEAFLTKIIEVIGGASPTLTLKKQAVGTGTTLDLSVGGVVVESYTVLLFGDVDGDGFENANDSLIVNLIASNLIPKSSCAAVVQTAADVNKDGTIDSLDSQFLSDAGLYLKTVLQTF